MENVIPIKLLIVIFRYGYKTGIPMLCYTLSARCLTVVKQKLGLN